MTTPKSCFDCPSYMESSKIAQMFGRTAGSPMCGTFGHVLDKPDHEPAQTLAVNEHYAENCPKYGEPAPSISTLGDSLSKMYVMLPDPTVRDPANIDAAKQSACTNCTMCSNFAPEDVVMNETGWSTGMCGAKGKLILANRTNSEARDCEYRQWGTVRTDLGGLSFQAPYESHFGMPSTAPVAQYMEAKRQGTVVDPTEYVSDKPVSDGDTASGVRAWRKVEDPEGTGNAVWFPIYDPSFFDDDERALIPKTGSDEHPELYLDHFGGLYGLGVAWMELDETPVFWGKPGVGKTELLRYAAWCMQLPFHRISFTATTEVDDTIGKMMFSPDKGTYFHYGRLPKVWQQPGVLCLDEPNTAPPEIWQAIRPLTDNSKQMVVDQSDRPVPLERHADCYMGMAMNPAWDTRNVGALEIADADANRLFHTYIEMPPPELEKEIIQARVALDGWKLDSDQLTALMKTATDLRGLIDQDQLSITWAIRPQIKVARALKWFSPTTAYRRAAGDYLDPQALQILLDQVRQNFKTESKNNNTPGNPVHLPTSNPF